MLYNPLLNKAASKLTTRGALRYVHQDPNGGEFVASDGTVMLVENSGTPFLTAFWDTDTLNPVDCADEYPDWRKVLSDGIKNANKPYRADKPVKQEGFAAVYIPARQNINWCGILSALTLLSVFRSMPVIRYISATLIKAGRR